MLIVLAVVLVGIGNSVGAVPLWLWILIGVTVTAVAGVAIYLLANRSAGRISSPHRVVGQCDPLEAFGHRTKQVHQQIACSTVLDLDLDGGSGRTNAVHSDVWRSPLPKSKSNSGSVRSCGTSGSLVVLSLILALGVLVTPRPSNDTFANACGLLLAWS
ncbi:hypothetical protein [Streptomyces avermitilis]|uniref:hypothetical protein n=1 Tax=Streptomyces avermitilis TaxID=33903 RepID=UPI00381A840B